MRNCSPIRINHFDKEILISKSFQKATMNPYSDEYRELAEVMAVHPNYKIVQRIIKTNPRKETYEGLTYEYMRDYIILSATPEEELAAVAEFDEMILISKCHARALRYPTIKRWFLAKYPEVAEFGVEAAYKALKAS
jgi:hypothetical protein